MSQTMTESRPGVVTFVGVVLYIKAVLAVVVGIALLVEKDSSALQSITGQDSDFLTSTAIGEFVVAVLLLLVAFAIMSGQKWARLAIAIVMAIRIGFAGYWMIAHIGGGLQWNAILSVGIAMFVLWALYGNEHSQAYFEGYP